MTEEMTDQETLEFRAQVQQLLNILANSLYTEREIFMRELISNASDALHRVQFEMLTNREVLDPDAELAIRVAFDAEARTLTIADTGIGMTREELIENLGTIAHSGAMAFLQGLEQGQRPDDMIGQFGVGFYSVFMVAEQVTVTSRSYRPAASAWHWTSRGDSRFTLSPAAQETRGTVVEIQLKEDAVEFASAWRLKQVIKKHSDYVSFPIYMEDEVVNQQVALWRQQPQMVEEQEYQDFYRQLTLDLQTPLLHIHLVADAPVNVRSILYVPRQLERGPLRLRTDVGLRLYSRKVLIQDYNTDLLPEYLRFVEGVVDSEDLPLNISRETVQSSAVMRQLQKALTGRLLKALREMAEERPDDYSIFWSEFGPFIKQGVATNPLDQGDLLPLLRFHSSRSDGELISLADYVARMGEDQGAIYYILGDDRAAVSHSPHLDVFKAHGLEVLYLLDPLDGFVMQSLREYEDKPFQNVDDPDLDLPALEKEDAEAEAAGESVSQVEFDQLAARFERVLGEQVTEVKPSKVLTDSPCRLVSPAGGPERDLRRVRRLLGQEVDTPPKLLEINRRHPLIQNLARLVVNRPDDAVIDAAMEQLWENLLLLEGLHPNPAQMVPRIQVLLAAATERIGDNDD
ncbi:MAG TPA: molecular chaperone HtpG [Chloroflexi bacterium]|nr:molecular chaperone HtpG [Chloroflexota bacterium]